MLTVAAVPHLLQEGACGAAAAASARQADLEILASLPPGLVRSISKRLASGSLIREEAEGASCQPQAPATQEGAEEAELLAARAAAGVPGGGVAPVHNGARDASGGAAVTPSEEGEEEADQGVQDEQMVVHSREQLPEGAAGEPSGGMAPVHNGACDASGAAEEGDQGVQDEQMVHSREQLPEGAAGAAAPPSLLAVELQLREGEASMGAQQPTRATEPLHMDGSDSSSQGLPNKDLPLHSCEQLAAPVSGEQAEEQQGSALLTSNRRQQAAHNTLPSGTTVPELEEPPAAPAAARRAFADRSGKPSGSRPHIWLGWDGLPPGDYAPSRATQSAALPAALHSSPPSCSDGSEAGPAERETASCATLPHVLPAEGMMQRTGQPAAGAAAAPQAGAGAKGGKAGKRKHAGPILKLARQIWSY